jgi:hypothetical protein
MDYPLGPSHDRVLGTDPSCLEVISVESLDPGEGHVLREWRLREFGESDREEDDLEWDEFDDSDHENGNLGSHLINVATLVTRTGA